MKLVMGLNSRDIKNSIRELELYRDSLKSKNTIFLEKLLDEGIEVAKENVGYYRYFIKFSKKVEDGETAVGFLIGDSKPAVVVWDKRGKKAQAVVNPLLMAEFGSGHLAEVLFDIAGVGQGTFPGQTHAFDDVWHWKEWSEDHKGEWHHSKGFRPTHPMYQAEMDMIKEVVNIAKEVYGGEK